MLNDEIRREELKDVGLEKIISINYLSRVEVC